VHATGPVPCRHPTCQLLSAACGYTSPSNHPHSGSVRDACAGHNPNSSLMASRCRQVYDSGAVVRLPFLTLSQLPPAALLNDPRLDYLPPGQSLPEVRRRRLNPAANPSSVPLSVLLGTMSPWGHRQTCPLQINCIVVRQFRQVAAALKVALKEACELRASPSCSSLTVRARAHGCSPLAHDECFGPCKVGA